MKIEFQNTFIRVSNLDEFVPKATDFALRWYPTVQHHYAERGQSNRKAIIGQAIQSKLAEFAVQFLMEHIGLNCTKGVDLKVYSKYFKKFDADLEFDKKLAINVKTQSLETSKAGYPLSWVLQYNGKGENHTDPMFEGKGESKYFALCSMEDLDTVIIHATPKIKEVLSGDYLSLPKSKKLQETKRVIMFDKLQKASGSFRWGLLNEVSKIR